MTKIDKPVMLTANAAKHIKEELAKSQHSGDNIVGLKLGVKVSGCSGYAYVLDWVKSSDNTDSYKIFNSYDVAVYVDENSYQYLAGTEVDYIQQGISKVMVFNNPNATAECGCGESFTIDQDKA